VPVRPTKIEFRTNVSGEITHLFDRADTRIFYKKPELSRHLMLFLYSDVQSGDIFRKWFSSLKHLSQFYKVYFDTIFNPDLYTENVFLNYVTALETFHKIVYPLSNKALTNKHEKRLEGIFSRIQKKDLEWLKANLKPGVIQTREATLSDRIAFLITTYDSSKLIFRSRRGIADKIATKRNAIVHRYSSAAKKESIKNAELHKWNRSIRAFIQSIILQYLGFDLVSTQKHLRRHNLFLSQ